MSKTCSAIHSLIQQQVDGQALDAGHAQRVAEHVLVCHACYGWQRDMERLAALMTRLPRQQAPADMIDQIVHAVSLPRQGRAGWLERLVQAWAPAAALLGVCILIYQAVGASGVSIVNLPGALGEWLALIDLQSLDSLAVATALLAASIGAEFLIGVSLLALASFAMMGQVMSHAPLTGLPVRR